LSMSSSAARSRDGQVQKGRIQVGKFSIVNLAGSKRKSKTRATSLFINYPISHGKHLLSYMVRNTDFQRR
jgi:hypothetical protein